MRILSVTAQKPNSTGSGVYLTELMRGFAGQGMEQALLCGVYREDEIVVPDGTNVYPVYFHSEELPYPIAGMSDEMPYESLRYCDMTEEITEKFLGAFRKKLHQAVAEFQPDLILCHHLYLVTALVREEFPDIKVAGLCHGSDLRQLEKNPLRREEIKEQIRKLDQIFCLHQAQKERIQRDFSRPGTEEQGMVPVPEDQIAILGSGYNAEVFHRMDVTKDTEKLVILFAGKLSEKKGVMSLIRSLNVLAELRGVRPQNAELRGARPRNTELRGARPRNAELRLAGGYGNDAEYQEIQRLIEEAAYPVKILGRLPQPELARQMNLADIFILPSFYEGLPLVILEAAACGAKVICSDLPGIQDWIDASVPDSGFVFVEPPKMRFADEPEESELPVFERRLAEAVMRLERQDDKQTDVSHLSWGAICSKILNTL